ncbi:MAG TPA: hemolysin family protein [Phycisphaerales bacterium]|nr:hemolysin family protein [Phycisphaerales bacterium]
MTGLAAIFLPVLAPLLAAAALCSASETALFGLTHADKLRLRRTNPRVHDAAAELTRHPQSLLVAILLLNVCVNTAYFTVAGLAGGQVAKRAEAAWAAPAVAGAAVLAMILFGEVLPKSIAAVHRVAACRVLAVPVLAWFRLLTPVRVLLTRFVIAPLARLFRSTNAPAQTLTADDLSKLVEAGAREGVLHEREQHLLADVVQLSSLRVKEIMTPRVDVRWLDAVGTSQELLQVARETGWSRFPVCRGRFDERQIVGVVHAQRVLPVLAKQGAAARVALPSLVEPARFVPERARVDQLLEFFRSTRSDVAMVVNEQGELTGMVQIDNVVNELVNFAGPAEEAPESKVRMVGVGRWEVPGRMSVRHWEEFFDPTTGRDGRPDQVTTVGGLLIARLGRLPRVGDEVRLGNVRMRVEALRGRTVETVTVAVDEPAGADGAAAQSGEGGS